MNSIYKQLDKIDDNNSLNEKWNVKNRRDVECLKEDVQRLDETNPLIKEIQEYIHDNIFEWNTIGFENDHIYVVFDEDTEDYTIDSCEEELEDEFGHACELAFELENENTLLIYVSISDEVDDDNYEWFVEHQVDYSLRAKDAQIIERDYGYEFLWISQEDLSEDDAYELAVATNNYLVHLNKVGKLVKGTCYCRSYPEDDYKVQFTVKENLRFTDVEDATVYEYGIIDDSEYFEEEYTTDWNKAQETFKNIVQKVQKRLIDLDEEDYDDYYSDGVVVRMIKGKEGSDAFDWDTIREVTVFRDHIENEEELEESMNEERNVKNQPELKQLKENFKVRQYSLDWDGEYEWADEETFDTMDEAQIRFNELKEVIDNGEFDYAAIALVDENDDDISIYGEPERQKVTKEDVIEYLRDREEVSLTDEEFDYVVEDLWDAIWREMREGSRYETIDDVDMVELIDASDNPTHDLCYKLMGLLGDDD